MYFHSCVVLTRFLQIVENVPEDKKQKRKFIIFSETVFENLTYDLLTRKLRADLRKYSGRRKRKLTYLPCTSCSMAIWVWEIVARLWIAIVVINICRSLKKCKNFQKVVNCKWNGILLPKLFWQRKKKNCSTDCENFWNWRLKAENLQKCWDH